MTEMQPAPSPRATVRKALSVLELVDMGYQFDEIATIMDLKDEDEARAQFERGLVRYLKDDPDAPAKMRAVATRRLDRLLRSVWPKAIDPNHEDQMTAQSRALAIIDRHIKLHGLDSPAQLNVDINPSNDELNAFVATVLAMRENHPEEGDIFEAEVVEPPALEA